MADFTNIDGAYAKDTELRNGIGTLRTTVLSNTIKPLTVTKNDTYTAIPSSGTYGYSPIIVDVQEEPWQPLQDGYSNFWFELTNDTLSPWLNFSAKNNDAVIDWGDGSGEQALTTLTPTHTYAKAGRYVVKIKGVTGIGIQNIPPLNGDYLSVLKNVELNSEVTTISNVAFRYEIRLRNVVCHGSVTVGASTLAYCSAVQSIDVPASVNMSGTTLFSTCLSLKEYVLPNGTTEIGTSQFYSCSSLAKITIPQNVVSIGNLAFSGCNTLSEIHIQATTPPTVGTNAFQNIASGYVMYVPTGTLSAYQTAWSAYADHIVEEGQTLSNAALRRIQAEKNDDIEEMR